MTRHTNEPIVLPVAEGLLFRRNYDFIILESRLRIMKTLNSKIMICLTPTLKKIQIGSPGIYLKVFTFIFTSSRSFPSMHFLYIHF